MELIVQSRSRAILPLQDLWFGVAFTATTTNILIWEPSSWRRDHLSKNIFKANQFIWWIFIKSMLTFWAWNLNQIMVPGPAFDLTLPTVPHSPKSSIGIQSSSWLCWSFWDISFEKLYTNQNESYQQNNEYQYYICLSKSLMFYLRR